MRRARLWRANRKRTPLTIAGVLGPGGRRNAAAAVGADPSRVGVAVATLVDT
jgi:hypothetical protein